VEIRNRPPLRKSGQKQTWTRKQGKKMANVVCDNGHINGAGRALKFLVLQKGEWKGGAKPLQQNLRKSCSSGGGEGGEKNRATQKRVLGIGKFCVGVSRF